MFAAVVDFSVLLLASLLVGVMFAVWLCFNPAGLEPAFYVAQQQNNIRALNVGLPLLGLAVIVLTVMAAMLARHDGLRLSLLVGTLACFVGAGLVTRLLNQPINAIVMTWTPSAPPADWGALRDAWWRWHILRLVFGLGGLSLLIVATLQRSALR